MVDPFPKLPPEIISRFFELQDWEWPSGYFDSPLKLGEVCRLWRNIAWRTPSLWNVALVAFDPACAPSVAAGVKGFREYIGRSGCLPLTLHVRAKDEWENRICEHEESDTDENEGPNQAGFDEETALTEGSNQEPEVPVQEEEEAAQEKELANMAFHALIETINQCSSRWYYLYLRIPTYKWSSFTFDPAQPPTKLRCLWLAGFSDDADSELPQSFSQSFVDLEWLNLDHVNLIPLLEEPWKNLTMLRLRALSASACLEVLRNSPALLQAHFRVPPRAISPEDPQLLHLIHMSLEALQFGCAESVESRIFFSAVTLPKLKTLVLKGRLDAMPTINMLKRSNPAVLYTVVLADLGWRAEELCLCLFQLNVVKRIRIEDALPPYFSPVIFQVLFSHPTLEDISFFHLWQQSCWPFLRLISLEKKRILRKIRISFRIEGLYTTKLFLEPSILKHVLDLRSAGVEIDLGVACPTVPDLDVIQASSTYHSSLDSLD